MLSWIKVGAGILYDRRMRARVLGYRPGIICLVKSTQTDRFLFITPTEKPTAWMPPQEGIEADESPKAAAIRCLRVELGIPEEKTHFRKTVWLGCKEIPEQQADVMSSTPSSQCEGKPTTLASSKWMSQRRSY